MAERVCPNCSRPVQAGDETCAHCGAAFFPSTVVLPSGTILRARYQIEQLVHTGGMGYVYLAKDRNLFDRYCIVKQVRDRVQSEEHQKRLEEEALRMARLSHPRIATILDHFVEDGCYFIVVERIYGKTLSDIFKDRQGQLSENQVVDWATSICEVLAYLHKEEVVHRDISPDNIMITEQGDVKLIDFGTLRELRYVAAGGTAGMGKYGYAPPEQWQGNPEPRSDIFALGATIYYLLTGFLPLSNAYQVRQTPEKEDYCPVFPPVRTKNRVLSRSLENILQKALELDVNLRFNSAVEMGDALGHLRREPAKRTARLTGAKRVSNKRRTYLMAATAVLALGLIAAGIYLVQLGAGA